MNRYILPTIAGCLGLGVWMTRPATRVEIHRTYETARHQEGMTHHTPVVDLRRYKTISVFEPRKMTVTGMSDEDAIAYAIDLGFQESPAFWRFVFGYKGLPPSYKGVDPSLCRSVPTTVK